MLFYEASGKRQRTCDQCVSSGGPPTECLANKDRQKNFFQLAVEMKKANDVKKLEEEAEEDPSKQAKLALEKAKIKAPSVHGCGLCDWGVTKSRANKQGLLEPGESAKFTVLLCPEAAEGDVVEVRRLLLRLILI